MKNNKKAFTFIELIVAAVILVLISSIGFYSFVWYLSETRDWSRRSNMISMKAALKSHKQARGVYPLPWDYFSITNNATAVAYQWRFNENLKILDLEKLPLDPTTGESYFYSTKKNRQTYQIAMSLENGDFPVAMLDWDYETISKTMLPSLVLALSSTTDIEIKDWVWDWATNRNYFILNSSENLPYSFDKPYDPYYAWWDIDTDLAWGLTTYTQDSTYKSCIEIWESKDAIWAGDYEIVTTEGLLTTVTCNACSAIWLIDSRDSCGTSKPWICWNDNWWSITSEPFWIAACDNWNKYNYEWDLTTATWECRWAWPFDWIDAECSATYTP